ncbi:MAG: hypothetical protein RI973_2437 [Bacteroidota bacterium]|jgi:hypothetical protein
MPAERPFRVPSGVGGTSRKGFLHNPRAFCKKASRQCIPDAPIFRQLPAAGKSHSYLLTCTFSVWLPVKPVTLSR